MKFLVFNELLLASETERRALRVEFDPKRTILVGENDTGKSSILKSLYQTLGAIPPNLHPRWAEAKVASFLRFTVEGAHYGVLLAAGTYTVFGRNDEVLRRCKSVTKELGPFLANLLDFHLPLVAQSDGKETQATPAFLFLPFYFDQDHGWSKNWNSFERLSQFSRWRTDVANFHAGIRPSEYYRAKAAATEADAAAEPIRGERRIATALMQTVQTRLAEIDFDVDLDSYRKEIETLLAHCEELRQEEAAFKRDLGEALAAQHLLEQQIAVARHVADELKADHSFATEKLDDQVQCPVCSASYSNSFSERFSIAADEDRCRAVLAELEAELQKVRQKAAAARERSGTATAKAARVQALLEQRKGSVRLADVVRSEGQKELRGVLTADIEALNRRIGELDGKAEKAREKMKSFEDRERKSEILDSYRRTMGQHLRALSVDDMPNTAYKRIDARITETGSDLPRALLAYYFAVLKTARTYSSSAFCPIVIDSPKQQDQDDTNWEKMLRFMLNEQPADSQMILAVANDVKRIVSSARDGRVHHLKDKRSVLKEAQYEPVMARLRPMLDASQVSV